MASRAEAAERRTYPCHRLAQAPVIDGKMDDEAWANIPEAAGFYIFQGFENFAIQKQTCFKAGWKDDAIYFIVRAEETVPEEMIAMAKKGRMLWEDNSIELFFFPPDAQKCTQLIANSTARLYAAQGNKGITISPDLEIRASVGKTEWFLEWRIPVTMLMAKPPKEGDEWPVNVARNILTGPSNERHTAWPFLNKGFGDIKKFGRFVFKGEASGKPIAEENDINRTYVRYMHGEIKKLNGGPAERYMKELAEVKKLAPENIEAKSLFSSWEQIVRLSKQPSPDYRELTHMRGPNLRNRSDDCIARAMMEALLK
ncbi:MAG: sugar-binding protein [Verrucomicrobiae bacterium]|nr:sugar-binding protein [Verrucomicrobiae bacterium]